MSANFFLVDIEKIACYTVHELGKAIGFFQKEECSRTSLFFCFYISILLLTRTYKPYRNNSLLPFVYIGLKVAHAHLLSKGFLSKK